MSVTMSVKGIDSSSLCPKSRLRNPSPRLNKFGKKSCSPYHLNGPVDDDVHSVWNTPQVVVDNKKFSVIFGGQLRSTPASSDCRFGRGGFAASPLFTRLSATSARLTSAGQDSFRTCCVVQMSALGSSWTCPGCVSAFSREAFWRFRRDVMTMTALLRIKDVQSRLSVPRSTVYELIDKGELERVYIASAPRIVDDSVEAYIDRLRVPGRMTVRQRASR